MSHSEICPVCGGTGIFECVQYEQLNAPYPFVTGPIKSYSKRTCHGCQGKGWITVEDKQWKPNYYGTDSKDTYMTGHTTYNHIPHID